MDFPAQLPFEKWPAVANVFELMAQRRWSEAQVAFEAKRHAVTDSIHAGNDWWHKVNDTGGPTGPTGEPGPTEPGPTGEPGPDPTSGTLEQVPEPNANGSNSPLAYDPNIKRYYQATRDGRAGNSLASGSNRVWCAIGSGPGKDDIGLTAAVGAVPYQDVIAGDFITMWAEIEDPQSGLYNLAVP